MVNHTKRAAGFTLIEMMVTLAVGSMIAIGVLAAFTGQADAIRQETARDSTTKEIDTAFNTVADLLRHAQASSVVLSYGASGQRNPVDAILKRVTPYVADDALTVDFMLPADLSIWPNDVAPFANRAVRLTWTNQIGSAERDTLLIGTATTIAGLAGTTMMRLSGSAVEGSPHIINFDLWPLTDKFVPATTATALAATGYLLQLDARAGQIDASYDNKIAGMETLKRYRIASASGAVTPRN